MRVVIDAHHVISQETLRKMGREDLLWVVENGMPVARRVHQNHENASKRIPRVVVPAVAVAFAEQLGLGWMIERDYP